MKNKVVIALTLVIVLATVGAAYLAWSSKGDIVNKLSTMPINSLRELPQTNVTDQTPAQNKPATTAPAENITTNDIDQAISDLDKADTGDPGFTGTELDNITN